jgi:hypothetical protein
VDARFGLFADSATLDARWVHGLGRMYLSSEKVLEAPDRTPR